MTVSLEYGALAPILILLTAGVVSVLVEAFAPRQVRRALQIMLSFASLLAAGVYVIVNWTKVSNVVAAQGSAAIDGPGLILQGIILVIALVAGLLLAERNVDPQGDAFAARASALPGSEDEQQFTNQGWFQTEVWPLYLFSVGGMLLFVVANDLLTMFVALEVFSLPLYLIAGMARRRRLASQEAALKYFVLGAFASAFFLFGSALVYNVVGSVTFGDIAKTIGNVMQDRLLFTGVAMIAVGLLFKIGSAPFHQWTPDVYQGAPTPLTAFMAAATKVSAVGALLRVFYVAFGGLRWDWQPILSAVAVLTMIVGALLAFTQPDIKRMLAYSSVAHAGFILLGVIAGSPAGLSATLFYLVGYGLTTVGAFAIVSLVRDEAGEVSTIDQWAGLGRKSPWTAGFFTIFLLALAGIPLTSGFTGKFAVFAAAAASGATWLVIVAVIISAITAYFYARVIVLMYFTPAPEHGPSVVVPGLLTNVAIGVSVAVTLLLGILPQPVLALLNDAGVFVR